MRRIDLRRPELKRLLAYKLLRHFWNALLSIESIFSGAWAIVREHRMDKRLGIETWEHHPVPDGLGLCKDAYFYLPTPFQALSGILDHIHLTPEDEFLDFGCGKGRAVLLASMRPVRRAVGVELRKELYDIALSNAASFKLNKSPIELVNCDAVDFPIVNETIFFFYIPFGRKTFLRVIENISRSLARNPRKICIADVGTAYKDILESVPGLRLAPPPRQGLRVHDLAELIRGSGRKWLLVAVAGGHPHRLPEGVLFLLELGRGLHPLINEVARRLGDAFALPLGPLRHCPRATVWGRF